MPHISFSELKLWDQCAYYHKLIKIDNLKGFVGNEFTAFGNAVHNVCENILRKTRREPEEVFLSSFIKIVDGLSKDGVPMDQKLIDQMGEQGISLLPEIQGALDSYFEDYKVISAEENLMVPTDEEGYMFKGFIDGVVKTSDGKYHIFDWKTCSWGWDSRRKSDPMTTYQLTLYKHFYAKKHNLDPKNIETHFALLKRTAKNNKVEFFRVTSGKLKTDRALALLSKAVKNIKAGSCIKNRLACQKCEFHKTVHCT